MITTAADDGTASGAVYKPVLSIVPSPAVCCAVIPATPLTSHVVAVPLLDEGFTTVAPNWSCAPVSTVPEVGEIVTVGVVELLLFLQPLNPMEASSATARNARFIERLRLQPAASSSQTSSLLPISCSSPISFSCAVLVGSNEFYLNSVRCKLSPESPATPPVGTSW